MLIMTSLIVFLLSVIYCRLDDLWRERNGQTMPMSERLTCMAIGVGSVMYAILSLIL